VKESVAMDLASLRVAIIHERFTELGGSERVVEQLHRLWPDAAIHGALVDRNALPPGLAQASVRPSALQHLFRGGGSQYSHLLPLLPLAMSHLNVGDVDLVVTSHHAFANRVRPPTGVPVISYTHTPARWLWDPAMRTGEVGGRLGGAALAAFAASQRASDRQAAQRMAQIIVNSAHVALRVKTWWGRESTVVHPPVDVSWYHPDPAVRREDFFLFAGRLVPYKRPEVAVAAAQRARVRLVVAGAGRSTAAIRRIVGPGVELLGKVSDEVLRDLYRRCRALVFPGEEDFGIVPVEAQACGTPVLALQAGGILDSVVDGITGVLYRTGPSSHVEVLAEELRRFDAAQFDPAEIRRHATGFSRAAFRSRFAAAVSRTLGDRTG
jgi:glycosyltransferase involved in cell wall biosynthesis